jgi:phage-related baseplate assembly protein
MAIASDSFTGVDLSRLPAPDVIEPLDFETIRSLALTKLIELLPAFDATVESDPAVKLAELWAFLELILRQRVNEAARAVMPAFAHAADLDHLAATFGIERFVLDPGDPEEGVPPSLETDEDFRRRMVLAPEGYSVAGPAGAYIFHALSADAGVLDASVDSPEPDDIRQIVLNVLDAQDAEPALVEAMTDALDEAAWPGEVFVTLLARQGDGAADADLLAAVDARLNGQSIRPLTDFVTVRSADIVPFAIEAAITFLAGPDRALVMAEAQARLARHIAATRRLGRDPTRAGIIAALHPEGVQNVNLIHPAADIVLTRRQAGHCTGVTLTDAGTGE